LTTTPKLEILDLRHFSAAQLGPLLRDEAAHWQQRLQWNYDQATSIVLDYLDGRILPGFVAVEADGGRICGYAFCVFEGAKAVIGDIYAFGETTTVNNPIGDMLLRHMLEMLQATPGVERIESQLLMYPSGSLAAPFEAFGFHCHPRLFMSRDIASPQAPGPQPTEVFQQHGLTLQTWHPIFYDAAAGLIHRCYAGHMDSSINDQYQTYYGAQRFLHNIIRFPGCGLFDAENSFVLRDGRTNEMKAILLSSRIRPNVAHITQLCIAPALRGQGIGRALLQHCSTNGAAKGLTSISLTVTEANATAQQLYRNNGFLPQHRFDAMVWDKSHVAP
jgi:ribosomal protein S18 acetylase RimI-like enzyme